MHASPNVTTFTTTHHGTVNATTASAPESDANTRARINIYLDDDGDRRPPPPVVVVERSRVTRDR